MKKIVSLLLCFLITFSLVSCHSEPDSPDDPAMNPPPSDDSADNGDGNDKEPASPDSETTPDREENLASVLFSSYDDVLNTFSKIAKHGSKETFETGMPELDSREQTIYQRLCDITSQMFNKTNECELRCSLLDIDGDGTEEMRAVVLLKEEDWHYTPLEETETIFTLRSGVPTLDDGTLLEHYRQMEENETPPTKPILDSPLVTHPHYRMVQLDFQNGRSEKIEYEIYASNGTVVRTGDAKTSFWGYREGDLIEFSADSRIFFYSISQNKFSENDFTGYVEYSRASQKVAYVKDGVLTVQNIFDRNAYYEEFPNYQEPYSYYFAEDGKSISFRHYVEGAKKDATSVICFEELPIVRAIKICYVRTGPGTSHDILMPSSGTYAYLRSATHDTARLLQAEPIIGGSYESDNGTTRNDWYKISYQGRVCYVSADSFEVDIYRATSKAEIAMQMYEAVLKNELKVIDPDTNEFHYLKDCKTPYNRISLCELGSMSYVYMDVDGDLINELVINCGDSLILRYYEGLVYVYPFTFRNMSSLNTDGSYGWNHTGQNFEYGENKIAFDGTELKPKEIWRIVNDGEPNAEYYIDGKQVTQKELLKYCEDNPKTKVEFSPLEVSWLNKISYAEALALAREYWEHLDIEENGYIVERGTNSSATSSVYVFVIRRYVMDHYSTFDEIWIDKNTGEAIVPYISDGK